MIGYYTVNEGISCVSNNALYAQYSNDSSWSFSKGSNSHSGNTVCGYGRFTDKFLFITIQTININISMSCDKYGNLY